MLSVGHQLMKARKARSLSIEDVAFETSIPHSHVRDMENDDLSNFANLTYAKGFLKLYSRYLSLDLSDYLDEFDTSLISDVTGHEYMHTVNSTRLLSAPAMTMDDGARNRPAGNALGFAALTAVLLGGGWLFYNSHANQGVASSDPPAKQVPATGVAGVPAAGPPTSSPTRNNNTFAKADTTGLGSVPSPGPVPALNSPIISSDTVRKATPVDDYGNEVKTARP